MSVRYLLDENVDPVYCVQLNRQKPELTVWAVGDPGAPKKSTLDPEILRWCEDHKFVLVTNNRASMPLHLADHLAEGRHVPGIFILNSGMGIGETIDELILVAMASFKDEFQDRITYLPYT